MRKSTLITLLMVIVSVCQMFVAVMNLADENWTQAITSLVCVVVAGIAILSQLTIRNLSDTL